MYSIKCEYERYFFVKLNAFEINIKGRKKKQQKNKNNTQKGVITKSKLTKHACENGSSREIRSKYYVENRI